VESSGFLVSSSLFVTGTLVGFEFVVDSVIHSIYL
jgi:hypothetical protein